ncbi:MAG: hypothetical protein ABIP03_06455 [Aquihabitans sp.]
MSDSQIPKKSTRSTTKRAAPAKPRAGRAAAQDKSADLPGSVTAANRKLRTAAELLSGAVTDLHESENLAWRQYSASVADAIARMNAELSVSMAQLKATQSEGGPGLADALREADEARRAVADNVRVQARLAAMDMQDRTKKATEGLEVLGERIEQMAALVRDASTTTVKGLAADSAELFALLRHAIRSPMR